MNKIAVIYASVHHGNTRKLVQEVSKEIPMDYYNVQEAKHKDLSAYELIGIASGLYFGKIHKTILDYLAVKPELPKNAFAIITCGDGRKKHSGDAERLLEAYGFQSKGAFVCKGFDTYGPLKFIGGINKNHPDEADVKQAIDFVGKL